MVQAQNGQYLVYIEVGIKVNSLICAVYLGCTIAVGETFLGISNVLLYLLFHLDSSGGKLLSHSPNCLLAWIIIIAVVLFDQEISINAFSSMLPTAEQQRTRKRKRKELEPVRDEDNYVSYRPSDYNSEQGSVKVIWLDVLYVA